MAQERSLLGRVALWCWARFGTAEWLVFVLLAPIVGVATILRPRDPLHFWTVFQSCGLRQGIDTLSCGGILAGLLGGGLILGVIAPRGRGVANVSVMGVVLSCVVIDSIKHPDDHNLIGVELLMYAAFTVAAMAAGCVGSTFRRSVAFGQ